LRLSALAGVHVPVPSAHMNPLKRRRHCPPGVSKSTDYSLLDLRSAVITEMLTSPVFGGRLYQRIFSASPVGWLHRCHHRGWKGARYKV
jgi:hypothetical protein